MFWLSSEKGCLICVNLQIMRFNGSVSENGWGNFLAKIAESIAIIVKPFSILMLDQFSQRRKMRLDKPFQKLQLFNVSPIKNLANCTS